MDGCRIVCHGIQDEDVDDIARIVFMKRLIAVNAGSVQRNIARHDLQVGFLHVGRAEHAVGRKVCGILTDLLELQPLVIGHKDVKVVVPGDDASVPDGANQGSATKKVRDSVLDADVVNLGAETQ